MLISGDALSEFILVLETKSGFSLSIRGTHTVVSSMMPEAHGSHPRVWVFLNTHLGDLYSTTCLGVSKYSPW